MIFLPLCFFRQMVSTPGYQLSRIGGIRPSPYKAPLKPDGLINIIFEATPPYLKIDLNPPLPTRADKYFSKLPMDSGYGLSAQFDRSH